MHRFGDYGQDLVIFEAPGWFFFPGWSALHYAVQSGSLEMALWMQMPCVIFDGAKSAEHDDNPWDMVFGRGMSDGIEWDTIGLFNIAMEKQHF